MRGSHKHKPTTTLPQDPDATVAHVAHVGIQGLLVSAKIERMASRHLSEPLTFYFQ